MGNGVLQVGNRFMKWPGCETEFFEEGYFMRFFVRKYMWIIDI